MLPIARRISVKALAAERAAERGDWQATHDIYEHLALLFAEYRLGYVQFLADNVRHRETDAGGGHSEIETKFEYDQLCQHGSLD